jgi:molybdenum cofactor synthesis domain-containing protein
MHSNSPTARIVVIGNELLSGKVEDSNSPWLMQRLRAQGVHCLGLVCVPDTVAEVSAAVRNAASSADFVFTSGGVGPTHDDVTMAGIAAAFDVALEEHPVIRAFLDERWRGPRSPARLRMAQVPAGTEVLDTESFPVVRCRNVYIFPGVPRLFRGRFESISHLFSGPTLACSAILSEQGESELAPLLEGVLTKHPSVDIGSYPRWKKTRWEVLLILEHTDEELLSQARKALLDTIDRERIIEVHEQYIPD